MNRPVGAGARPGLPPLLQVLDVGTTVETGGDAWPTAVVDARAHSEVADLPRVHAVDGIGDVETLAARVETGDGDLVVLGVRITTPVRCAFALEFRLPAHAPTLGAAVAAGRLVIATTPPATATRDRPLWLAVDVDGARLADVLAGA